jgi:hypothetical protein
MFAVVPRFLERRTTAFRRDTVTAEMDGGHVGVGVRALDTCRRVGLVDLQLANNLPLLIVKATKERSGAKKAPQTAIG